MRAKIINFLSKSKNNTPLPLHFPLIFSFLSTFAQKKQAKFVFPENKSYLCTHKIIGADWL